MICYWILYMHHLLSFLFVLAASFLFAKTEIAIEGPNGWAEKLPTWRLPKEHWASRLVFGGRPATGYHVWLNAFILFSAHAVYLFASFSWSVELRLISLFILFWALEDFLWFVLNPAFGLHNFKREKIWWHKDSWWWIAPSAYFIFIPVGVALYIASLYIK